MQIRYYRSKTRSARNIFIKELRVRREVIYPTVAHRGTSEPSLDILNTILNSKSHWADRIELLSMFTQALIQIHDVMEVIITAYWMYLGRIVKCL